MNEYSISDYGIFSDAIATTSQVQQNIESSNTILKEAQQSINNESVFMGPICDSCVNGFTKANSSFTKLNDNFTAIKSYLIESANTYKNGDMGASNAILNLDSTGAITTNMSASTGKKSGNVNQDYVHDYLASQGFNEAAICGILANIQKESNFKTESLGDGGTSYGICQWHNSRWDDLKNYCSSNNLDASSINGQVSFLVYELQNKYPEIYQELIAIPNTAQGAYDAAHLMTVKFEKPANTLSRAAERGDLAMSTLWPFYTS